MKCKHNRRSNWTSSISTYPDYMILETIQQNREEFTSATQPHYMQAWRQIYEAEARKRGLST